jgi:formylglycine-generating enzyme required for sulfatase activity
VSPERPLTTDERTRRGAHPRLICRAGVVAARLVLALAAVVGCRERASVEVEAEQLRAAAAAPAIATVVANLRPPSPLALEASDAAAPPVVRVNELEPAAPPEACPPTMIYVPGGEFWMGSAHGRGAREERPRFLTRVADFCIDTYEVTSASYEHCVGLGLCREPRGTASTCNYGKREDHPVNCVDWTQADAYCRSQGSRLPSELEWEYAARGGSKYYPFSWGHETAAQRTCWKTNQSCPVGSFAPGAFGLHDMSGNVWEWTNDWFGDYPWPSLSGRAKVFRGGGWNRRSEQSLGATLRNRASPSRFGAYLGFRCARLAKDAECPFGPSELPGLCRQGVLDVECGEGDQRFNGQRCAKPGAPLCGPYEDPIAGHGCVRRVDAPALDLASAEPREEAPARTRVPESDSDCRRDHPQRPSAYLIRGGTRPQRTRYARELRCKNRDIGADWNAVCCKR